MVNQAAFGVQTMCQVLGVSSSGYYGLLERVPSMRSVQNAVLVERIGTIHAAWRSMFVWWLNKEPTREQLRNLVFLLAEDPNSATFKEDIRSRIRKAKTYDPDIERLLDN